ncbi:polysaccharide biosynthesis protein [Candidatus Ruthia endofausta]|uniref:polysaccharide biosynthesis protein n=1 Tax=Candidatus Ruthia endofausta TaxID=2738852 RepID=UPI0024143E37|nr:polysaccharide biosynthesis protein [Candidatus Ruthia endofausta]
MSALAQSKVKVDYLRDVSIGDLLSRKPVRLNQSLLEVNIKNKVVMITGADESIGSEPCREVISLSASKLILFEQSELELCIIDKELKDSTKVFPILGSVVNQDRIERVCKQFKV